MPLPPVKLHFVADGVSNVTNALKSIEQAVIRHEASILRARQQSADAQLNVAKKLHAEISNLQNQRATSHLDNQFRAEKEHTSRMVGEYQRRSHLLSSVMRSLGLPSRIGGTNVAASLGSSGGFELSAGMLAGGAALGGILAAGAVIKKGFDILIDGVRFAANEFASAIVEIGGGIGVAGSIVRAAKVEREAAQIAASSPTTLHTKDAQSIINDVRSGTEFTSEEVAKALRKYQEKTGEAESFRDEGKFLTKIASTTGASLEQTTDTYTRLKTQFRNMSPEDLRQVVLNTIAQGQTGTVEFMNMGQAGALTGNAQNFAGSAPKNISKLIGLAQLVEPAAGSPAEAFTQEEAFIRQLTHNMSANPGFAKKLGAKYDAQGKLSNINDIVENAVVEFKKNPANFQKQFGGRIEAARFIQGMANNVEGTNEADIRKNFKETVAKFENPTMTMDNLDEKFKEVAETSQYQLKSSFSALADTIGQALLPAVNQLTGPLSDFAKSLGEHAPELQEIGTIFVDSIRVTIDIFKLLGPAIEGAIHIVLRATEMVGKGLGQFIGMIPQNERIFGDLAKNLTQLGTDAGDLDQKMQDRDEFGPVAARKTNMAVPLSVAGGLGSATDYFTTNVLGASSKEPNNLAPVLNAMGGIGSAADVFKTATDKQAEAANKLDAAADKISKALPETKPNERNGTPVGGRTASP